MARVSSEKTKVGQKVAQKHANKKTALVDAALATLSRLGYSQTNLRMIASDAGVSLGTIHYYFEDKDELLRLCVARIKDDFSNLIRNVFGSVGEGGDIGEQLAEALADTIEDNGATHRLWYDLRTQAMFVDTFRDEVARIEQEMSALLEGYFKQVGASHLDGKLVYLQLDAIFRHWLVKALTETSEWRAPFKQEFLKVLNSAMMAPPSV